MHIKLFFIILLFFSGIHLNSQEFVVKGRHRIQNRWIVYRCKEPKFLWFMVQKVGTSTISDILSRNFDMSYGTARGDLSDHYKFAFVRNPWDRVVSGYFNCILTKGWLPLKECFDKDFDYFVDYINQQDLERADMHIKLQAAFFPVEEMDFIGRFESFEEDLTNVLHAIGAKDLNFGHKNRSDHQHYSHYYTERTRDIIARKYKTDIEAFGYQFESE